MKGWLALRDRRLGYRASIDATELSILESGTGVTSINEECGWLC